MPAWLNDAVFYEIYPQSFYDSNGDGIGDIKGIEEKLDYVKGLGCNAIWINPCFDSPFKDAGYDVRDYKKVAPRYGTNDDLVHLFAAAHEKGMHILLDLVPGHTSEEHPWFLESKKAMPNAYSGRYIWTNHCFEGIAGHPYISGEAERAGSYMLNFFKCQPALNYGFLHPSLPWQKGMEDPDSIATKEAMKDVMRFWLDRGCDGFRVDMADSLVKEDDAQKTGTSRIWKDVRRMLDRDYPEAALVSEWSNPELSLKAGFHMDFMLSGFGRPSTYLVRDYENHGGDPAAEVIQALSLNAAKDHGEAPASTAGKASYTETEVNHGDAPGKKVNAANTTAVPVARIHSLPQTYTDRSYFKKDAGGTIRAFLNDYERMYTNTRNDGYISLISCNHDTARLTFNLDENERRLFFAFLFTMPGVPFLYYGDEIGMRYLAVPTKEGGYFRTGSRTPMQWDEGKNLGFSTAPANALYLPVDPAADAPTVQTQEAAPDSLYHTVQKLTALRHAHADLQADAGYDTLYGEDAVPLFVYRRGSLILAVNPSSKACTATLPAAYQGTHTKTIFAIHGGKTWDGEAAGKAEAADRAGYCDGKTITLQAQSFIVLE